LSILARDGIAAVWQLNLYATEAYPMGHPRAAVFVLENAAEQAWLRAEGARIFT
jgi:hypothetical protein